jgi:hypothetical protein
MLHCHSDYSVLLAKHPSRYILQIMSRHVLSDSPTNLIDVESSQTSVLWFHHPVAGGHLVSILSPSCP